MRARLAIGWLAILAIGVLLAARPATVHAGGGCEGAGVSDEQHGGLVELRVCFTPTVLHIAPGSTVTWVNRDEGITHTVTGANRLWDGGDLKTGQSVSFRFIDAGTFPYACIYHPGMIGAVVVGDGIGAAVSARSVTLVQSIPGAAIATSVPAAAIAVQAAPAAATATLGPLPSNLPLAGDDLSRAWPAAVVIATMLALGGVVVLLAGSSR